MARGLGVFAIISMTLLISLRTRRFRVDMTTINRPQCWYASQCGGDWEHHFGVKIDTLDNPGWRVVIDLVGTNLDAMVFAERPNLELETDWIR